MSIAALRTKGRRAIETRGALLTYPLQNRAEPRSLWSELYPKSKMKWAWDEDHDDRVGQIWRTRERLMHEREVVYAKWFQGRATFFARDVFVQLLAFLGTHQVAESPKLSPDSRGVMDVLGADSPLSTKQLKWAVRDGEKLFEAEWNRAIRPLWNHLCLVGVGEVADSSFPSLLVGATRLLFEELWNEAAGVDALVAGAALRERLGEDNPFYKYAVKQRRAFFGAP